MADLNGKLYKGGYSGLTYSDIAAFLSKTLSASEQTVVTALIADIEDYLCRACRRNFFIADGTTDNYYEVLDAGQDCYRPHNVPIKEITKINVDGTDWYVKGGSSNRLVLGTDFFVYESKVEFYVPPIASTYFKRKLTLYYSLDQFWGNDLKLAIMRWVSEIFLTREYGSAAVTRMNVQGFLMDFDPATNPTYIRSVIDSYRRVRL